MGARKNYLAAALSITAVLSLTSCSIANQALDLEAEKAKVASLEEKLRLAEKRASLSYDYRRASAVAQACDWPVVWRVCPAQDMALGKYAIQNNYLSLIPI